MSEWYWPYGLSEESDRLLTKFVKEHECALAPITFEDFESGKLGVAPSFRFEVRTRGNTIGYDHRVVCDCGKEANITDYEAW